MAGVFRLSVDGRRLVAALLLLDGKLMNVYLGVLVDDDAAFSFLQAVPRWWVLEDKPPMIPIGHS